MAESNFNWYGADESPEVVFPSVQAVAVYRNPAGNIVIRQQGDMGEDDSFVIVPRNHIDALLAAIKAAAADET